MWQKRQESNPGLPSELVLRVQVLRLTVINFDSLDEVMAVVSRRGGDLVRLQPAEPWQLRSYLNLTKQEDLEEAVAIQVRTLG